MYQEPKRNPGFTLVELMLAMSFIAILLVSIAMLSIYLTTLYDRGSTMKDITQAGTEIASDVKRSLAEASDTFPKARKYALRTLPTRLYVDIICTGSISYVSNRGDSLELLPNAQLIKSNGQPVRLAKISDSGGLLCIRPDDAPWVGSRNISVDARELLSREVSHTLSVWGLSATFSPNASNPELTTVLITIGTSESGDIDFPNKVDFPGDTDLPGDYTMCKTGNGSEWCGINTFEIVGRSGNGTEL